MLNFEVRKNRYSVWEKQVMENRYFVWQKKHLRFVVTGGVFFYFFILMSRFRISRMCSGGVVRCA